MSTRIRSRLVRTSLILLGLVFVVGPWPYPHRSGHLASTIGPPGRTVAQANPANTINVGWDEAVIESSEDRPLAGFIGRISTSAPASPSPCRVKAISVGNESSACTIVCVDLLLVDRMMAREILRRSGLQPLDVYFTATHTHSGFGGWGNHPLERLVAGTFDREFRDELCDAIARTILRSRAKMKPSEFAYVELDVPGLQVNRVERKSPTNDRLSALMFREASSARDAPPGAILVVFGAHATIESGIPPHLSGDYPAVLTKRLQDKTQAKFVGFAAGTVGDASPVRLDPRSPTNSAQLLGATLGDRLADAIEGANYDQTASLARLSARIDLPRPAILMGSPWVRFSPIVTWWVGGTSTTVAALRIGQVVLVGFPGDYAGELLRPLAEGLETPDLRIIPTSFNGDYVGYLVSENVFWERPSYETRSMNFYGPRIGDELNGVGRSLVREISSKGR